MGKAARLNRLRREARLSASLANRAAALARRVRARVFRAPTANRQRLVNQLTNWQRNQWARAGYPQDLRPFLTKTKT